MTDVGAMEGAEKPARRRKVATVTATQLGAHLDMTRQRVSAMVDEGIIRREPDGRFVQDECRVAYLRWLRDPARRSQKSAAEQAFLAEKVRALEIRNAQRLGELFPKAVALEVIDDYVAAVIIELQNMPGRVAGSDLVLRRRVEQAVFEARTAISGRMADKARQALPEGPAEAAKETANADD